MQLIEFDGSYRDAWRSAGRPPKMQIAFFCSLRATTRRNARRES
jgi:hypothetical protein